MDPFIDFALSSGLKSGYRISLTLAATDKDGSYWSWSATAWPVEYGKTGRRTFVIDETAVIRGSDIGGRPGNNSLPAIEKPH